MSDTSKILPKSRIIQIALVVSLPETASMDEVMEWVKFEVGETGELPDSNPLAECDLEVFQEPVLHDTSKHLHEEVKEIRTPNGLQFDIRKWSDDAVFTGKKADDVVSERIRNFSMKGGESLKEIKNRDQQ